MSALFSQAMGGLLARDFFKKKEEPAAPTPAPGPGPGAKQMRSGEGLAMRRRLMASRTGGGSSQAVKTLLGGP